MARNEVTVWIRAKNAAAAGLRSATRSFKQFATKVAAFARAAAVPIILMGTAAIGAATFFVKAWTKQENAVKRLEAALRANGDSVDTLLPRYKRFASEIQDLTGKGDEMTLGLMAQIRNLGIQPALMEKATKGAIGLATALGLGEAASVKYTAAALQGNFTMLQRYVPALQFAKTETEKLAIVNDLMASGFEQAKAQLDTVSGRWGELQGRIGDAAEEIGMAITGSDNLADSLKRMSQAIKDFQAVGGIPDFIADLKTAYNWAKKIHNLQKTLGFVPDPVGNIKTLKHLLPERESQGMKDKLARDREERKEKEAGAAAEAEAEAARAAAVAAAAKASQDAIRLEEENKRALEEFETSSRMFANNERKRAAEQKKQAQDVADAKIAAEEAVAAAKIAAINKGANAAKAEQQAEMARLGEVARAAGAAAAAAGQAAGANVAQFVAARKRAAAPGEQLEKEKARAEIIRGKLERAGGKVRFLNKADRQFIEDARARNKALDKRNKERKDQAAALKEQQEIRDNIAEDQRLARVALEQIVKDLKDNITVGGTL
jgi:hypothetical protein